MTTQQKKIIKKKSNSQTDDFRNTNYRKSRGYCFTLNNYTQDDIKALTELTCEYGFQEETGKQGTQHLQGYLYYPNAVSFESIKKIIPRAHIEVMKNLGASRNYCSKENTRTGKIYTNRENGTLGTVAQYDEPIPKKTPSQFYEFMKSEYRRQEHLAKLYEKGEIQWDDLDEDDQSFTLWYLKPVDIQKKDEPSYINGF